MNNYGFFSSDYLSDITGGGIKRVTTPGTQVALASSETSIKGVMIQALETNNGQIVVAGSDANEAIGARVGMVLNAGDMISLPIHDMSKVYIDAATATEGVAFLPLKG